MKTRKKKDGKFIITTSDKPVSGKKSKKGKGILTTRDLQEKEKESKEND